MQHKQWMCGCGYSNLYWRVNCNSCGGLWSPSCKPAQEAAAAASGRPKTPNGRSRTPTKWAKNAQNAQSSGQTNTANYYSGYQYGSHNGNRNGNQDGASSTWNHGNRGNQHAAGDTPWVKSSQAPLMLPDVDGSFHAYQPGYPYQALTDPDKQKQDELWRQQQQHKRAAVNDLKRKGLPDSDKSLMMLNTEIDELEESRQGLRPLPIRLKQQEHEVRKAQELIEKNRIMVKTAITELKSSVESHKKKKTLLEGLQKQMTRTTTTPTTVENTATLVPREEAERRHAEMLEQQRISFERMMEEKMMEMQRRHMQEMDEKLQLQARMLQGAHHPQDGETTPRGDGTARASGSTQEMKKEEMEVEAQAAERKRQLEVEEATRDEEVKKMARFAVEDGLASESELQELFREAENVVELE
eukprot:TRINITY_DN23817_c0_g1_i1.p2 TRINITY_DN23817_c0_g1~~TRINITY_DN23817_c0_g1_i1.p2  ORF type:complete len:414 (-),score=132.91 TRINITY_DN23817_c0_g1_i1:253-1494(-)